MDGVDVVGTVVIFSSEDGMFHQGLWRQHFYYRLRSVRGGCLRESLRGRGLRRISSLDDLCPLDQVFFLLFAYSQPSESMFRCDALLLRPGFSSAGDIRLMTFLLCTSTFFRVVL